MRKHSGVKQCLDSITVAGAAPDFHASHPSNRAERWRSGSLGSGSQGTGFPFDPRPPGTGNLKPWNERNA